VIDFTLYPYSASIYICNSIILHLVQCLPLLQKGYGAKVQVSVTVKLTSLIHNQEEWARQMPKVDFLNEVKVSLVDTCLRAPGAQRMRTGK